MNVNVKISINDEERDWLANLIDNKKSKRLATRKDVNNFVQGCVDAAIEIASGRADGYEVDTEASVKHLEDKDESYIRGWLQVGARYGLD